MAAPISSQNSVFFTPALFDKAILDHGVLITHYKAMVCPIGATMADDLRKPHNCNNPACESGWLIEKIGDITALFSNNTLNDQWKDAGIWESSNVVITFPRFYADKPTEQVRVLPYDRLYLKEPIMVEHWSKQVWSMTEIDSLKFPIARVERLIDSLGVEYKQDIDFTISKGRIKWIKTPGVDPSTNVGRVFSVRYLYQAYYIINSVQHELRIVTQRNPVTGVVTTVQMPMTAAIQRENVFRDADNKSDAPDKRKALAPSNIRSVTPDIANPLGGI